MTTQIFIARIFAAFILGAVIGVERQMRQRMAGLRTNTLVCIGAALFVALSALLPSTTIDTRIAAQVVSGIGFLGAGVILREGLSVRGLNTAATLWCASAVGVLCGMGFLLQATIGTMAVTAAHLLLRPLAGRINRGSPITDSSEDDFHFQFSVRCPVDDAQAVRAALADVINSSAMILRGGTQELEDEPEMCQVEAEILSPASAPDFVEALTRRMHLLPRVRSVRWKRLTDVT
jgi:putative Mg2+ transporter-C (MgtC) family protein